MLHGDTAIQAQRDVVIINKQPVHRLLILINLLWLVLLGAGVCFIPGERDIKEMVAAEVPEQVRLILLP